MESPIVNRFDELIHYTQESGLPEEQVLGLVKDLFPGFDPDLTEFHNDRFLTAANLAKYEYYRSIGLSVIECGQCINLSATLMAKLFKGEGLSLERLIDLAEAELFSVAKIKAKHLKNLDNSKERNASVTFLEKVFADQFSSRSKLAIANGLGQVDEDKDELKWTVEVHHVETSDKRSTDEKLLEQAKGGANAEG